MTHEQIAIWDRALTPQEMQAVSSYFMAYLAKGGKTLFSQLPLALEKRFQEESIL